MKLPLESRPMTGLQEEPQDIISDKTVVFNYDDNLPIKEKERTGYLVDGLIGLRQNLYYFLKSNEDKIKNRPYYLDVFSKLNQSIDIAEQILKKSNLTQFDYAQLFQVNRMFFRFFSVLLGSDLAEGNDFASLEKSLYFLGPTLYRFVHKNSDHELGPNEWKKFDPDPS